MNILFVLLFPSIIGLKLITNFNKDKKTFEYILDYLLLVFLTNFIASIIISIFNSGIYNIADYITNNLDFAIKYIIITCVLVVILSLLITIIKKYLTLDKYAISIIRPMSFKKVSNVEEKQEWGGVKVLEQKDNTKKVLLNNGAKLITKKYPSKPLQKLNL